MTQTSLTLRIVNMTSLADGGPLEASVAPGGMLEVGRDGGLDWCLPDPQRFISSRHFEIRSEKGGWMLYDISTNGTFVNGATTRVKSPCPLHDGDRLQVGQYSIEIRQHPMQQQGMGAFTPAGTTSGPATMPASGDISSLGSPAAAPSAPPQRPAARGLPGGMDPWAPQPSEPADPPQAEAQAWAVPPAAPSNPADIWAMPGATHKTAPPEQPAASPPGPGWPPATAPEPGPAPDPVAPLAQQGAQQTDAPRAAPPPGQTMQAGNPQAAALLEIIESAAGLAAGTLSRGDAQATAQEIGETLRALTEELSGLLQARAVARRSVRSAQVTMIGREDNNPLKFMPTPDQALSIMFGAARPGFQRGAAAVRSGFADIKTHQYATHAALQPALAQLLGELSPEAIEKRLEGVRLNRKSRAWEMYVERWDAKTANHDNGMLDVFLALYAEAYDRESGRG